MKQVIDFNRLPKQEYMKPTMRVVKIQQTQMLCSSPYDDVKSLHTYDDDDDVISNKNDIW
ncbi:MAG: hypothetical protein IJ559_01215 [Prevotella sp.]|nr:hypothetical protein [Prevotella sp.]